MGDDSIPLNLKTVSLFDSVHDFSKIAMDSTMLIREIKDEWKKKGVDYEEKFHNYLIKFLFSIIGIFGFDQDLEFLKNNSAISTFVGRLPTMHSGFNIEDYFFLKYLKQHISTEDQNKLNVVYTSRKGNNRLDKFTDRNYVVDDSNLLFDIEILKNTKKLHLLKDDSDKTETYGEYNHKTLTDFFSEEYSVEDVELFEGRKIIPLVIDVQSNLYKLIRYCKDNPTIENSNIKLMYCLNQEVINDPKTCTMTLDSESKDYFEYIAFEKQSNQSRKYNLVKDEESFKNFDTVTGFFNITFDGIYEGSSLLAEKLDDKARQVKFGTKVNMEKKDIESSNRYKKITNSDVNTVKFISDKIQGIQSDKDIRDFIHKYCIDNQEIVRLFEEFKNFDELYKKVEETLKASDGNESLKIISDFYKNINLFFSRKRFGDQLQVNSCKRKIDYNLVKQSKVIKNDEEKIVAKIDKETNLSLNNCVFVTFDRMAAAYALMKRIPVIYENTHKKIMILVKPKKDKKTLNEGDIETTIPENNNNISNNNSNNNNNISNNNSNNEVDDEVLKSEQKQEEEDDKEADNLNAALLRDNKEEQKEQYLKKLRPRKPRIAGSGGGNNSDPYKDVPEDPENMMDVFNPDFIKDNVLKYPDIFLHTSCYILTKNFGVLRTDVPEIYQKIRGLRNTSILNVSLLNIPGDKYYRETDVDFYMHNSSVRYDFIIEERYTKNQHNLFINLKDDDDEDLLKVDKTSADAFTLYFRKAKYKQIRREELRWLDEKNGLDIVKQRLEESHDIFDKLSMYLSEQSDTLNNNDFNDSEGGAIKEEPKNEFLKKRILYHIDHIKKNFTPVNDKDHLKIAKQALKLAKFDEEIMEFYLEALSTYELHTSSNHEAIKEYYNEYNVNGDYPILIPKDIDLYGFFYVLLSNLDKISIPHIGGLLKEYGSKDIYYEFRKVMSLFLKDKVDKIILDSFNVHHTYDFQGFMKIVEEDNNLMNKKIDDFEEYVEDDNKEDISSNLDKIYSNISFLNIYNDFKKLQTTDKKTTDLPPEAIVTPKPVINLAPVGETIPVMSGGLKKRKIKTIRSIYRSYRKKNKNNNLRKTLKKKYKRSKKTHYKKKIIRNRRKNKTKRKRKYTRQRN